MNILLFGASGHVGTLVLDEALRRGHAVTAFVHTSPLEPRDRLSIVRGDIYDPTDINAAISGHDAIISTLGSWGTKRKDVVSTAMRHIIPSASAHGIRRLVTVTGNIACAPEEDHAAGMRVSHGLMGLFAHRILKDADDHLARLYASDLDWTVVRSPVMTSSDGTSYVLNRKVFALSVSRHAVAHALVDLAENREWLQAAPFIHNA
jgi:putative NADH-flavin reductase